MKDKIQQTICLVLWALAVYLWTAYTFWQFFAFLFALHLTELLLKGWQAGKSSFDTIVMTLIFGFTWWPHWKNNFSINKAR